MSKKVKLPVRSLGSEVGDPSVGALSAWVAGHRGIEADLMTYKLEESLRVQEAVELPAAGGRFYSSRLLASIDGVREGVLLEEPAADTRQLAGDADHIVTQQKSAWCSLPPPHLWDLRDAYYHDEGEFRAALCVCTTQLMRAMRDRGVRGHVILGDLPLLEELEDLSGQKVLFYTENPDPDNLSLLLEFQRNIAVPSEGVSLVCNLLEEFDIASIIVIDPTREALARALSYFDKDAVFAGGYCRKECSQYWKHLIDSAYIHQ